MGLDGAGTRFISSTTHMSGSPGGSLDVVIELQPNGSYPANGEPLATLIALTTLVHKVKVPSGVAPDIVLIEQSNLGHSWTFDYVLGTFRNWTTVGATPSEHATGAYGGNEATATLRVFMKFPLFSSQTR